MKQSRIYRLSANSRVYVPMDPQVKAMIVRRVEERLGEKIIGPKIDTPMDIDRAVAMLATAHQLLSETYDEVRQQELWTIINELTFIVQKGGKV